MKKILIAALLLLNVIFASADEGRWLPHLLGQQIYDEMVKKGLKLTKDQLYNINKPSLKDAIVIFGRGCTGELVSNEGLVFTKDLRFCSRFLWPCRPGFFNGSRCQSFLLCK